MFEDNGLFHLMITRQLSMYNVLWLLVHVFIISINYPGDLLIILPPVLSLNGLAQCERFN